MLHRETMNSTLNQKSHVKGRDRFTISSKQIQQKDKSRNLNNEIKADRIEYVKRLPNIKQNSSKNTSNNKNIQLKDYQHTNNPTIVTPQLHKTNTSGKDRPKLGVLINIYHLFPDGIDSIHHSNKNNEVSIRYFLSFIK